MAVAPRRGAWSQQDPENAMRAINRGEGIFVNFLRRFQTEQNDFLGRIITGDETWVYSWDPETKRQSAEWRDFDEPRPEKVRRKQGALKVMHMIFFDMNGVILRWPVPTGTTINAQYYKKVLQDKLRPAIRKKRPGLLESGILFHHDNAPVHTARAVTDVLAGYKWELLEHPRYSPDLAPCGAIPTMIIFKEKNRKQQFGDDLPPLACFEISEKGGMTHELFVM
ncbi:hypothetical protein RRG08_023926 [Elysia crispata]|uniref:Transposase n=1 Tax=Elysia crispata TaxID=231223 RepID=A0AAE1D216_9GAST|nr:hypothetical protein RRG08_023926 [Elysia crispata]